MFCILYKLENSPLQRDNSDHHFAPLRTEIARNEIEMENGCNSVQRIDRAIEIVEARRRQFEGRVLSAEDARVFDWLNYEHDNLSRQRRDTCDHLEKKANELHQLTEQLNRNLTQLSILNEAAASICVTPVHERSSHIHQNSPSTSTSASPRKRSRILGSARRPATNSAPIQMTHMTGCNVHLPPHGSDSSSSS